jgi:hypothetical protein
MLNFLRISIFHFKCYVSVTYYFCCPWIAQYLYTHLKCPQAPVHITLTHVPHVTVHNHTKFTRILFSNKQRGLVNSGQV